MAERLGRFLLRQRVIVLIIILGITGFFGYQAANIRVESPLIDLFPKTHPYVETYTKYAGIFGGVCASAFMRVS